MKSKYKGPERRKFLRLDYATPLAYKICKRKTISKILQGYTSDISQAGILCNIKDKIKKGDILWLSFDRNTLNICADIEKRSLIYQNGVVGKVVRIEPGKNHTFDIGIQFVTREEKELRHIYPKVHFLKKQKGASACEEDYGDSEVSEEPVELAEPNTEEESLENEEEINEEEN